MNCTPGAKSVAMPHNVKKHPLRTHILPHHPGVFKGALCIAAQSTSAVVAPRRATINFVGRLRTSILAGAAASHVLESNAVAACHVAITIPCLPYYRSVQQVWCAHSASTKKMSDKCLLGILQPQNWGLRLYIGPGTRHDACIKSCHAT